MFYSELKQIFTFLYKILFVRPLLLFIAEELSAYLGKNSSFSSVKKMIQRLIRRRKVMKDPRAAGKLSIKTNEAHWKRPFPS